MTIWCIGKNYDKHVAEMGGSARPKAPVVFQKASGCLVPHGSPLSLPEWSQSTHHELELAFQLDRSLSPASLALALDLTARDIQAQAKSQGLPWSLSKSFKGACPITPWISLGDPKLRDWPSLYFQLSVHGKVRQRGRGEDMIFALPEILTFLKDHFPLEPGDIVLTGTPEGVGPLQPQDQLSLELEGFEPWTWEVRSPTP